MNRRGARPIIFVCSGISNGKLISEMVLAKTQSDASALFLKEYSVEAQIILGPFYKKSTQVLEVTRSLKFANHQIRKATYNEWMVNAFTLSEPADHAYIVFIKRLDDKKVPFPKGTITVPISELRFLNE
jgi:hypothetical protein